MSEYIFLYRSSETSQREAMGTPQRAQQSMEKWRAWLNDLAARGHVKNPGLPLERSGKVVSGKQRLVTDGPFAEKDVVGGFTLIEARDVAQAAELAGGCPVLEGGGHVEVRPVLKMEM
jgi:hypothetical protein